MTVSIDPHFSVAKASWQGQAQQYGADGGQDAADASDFQNDPAFAQGLAPLEPTPSAFFFTTGSVSSLTAKSTSSGSTPSETTVGGSAPVPSWVSGVSTASIATDMAAADVNGTVTYSGLETLLADLDAKLKSANSTLTAAELSDLNTIAANLNSGMTTSAYLTGIMNALVDGNAANATWTGGAASSTTLGNLAVGSSATQLSELIGKWFLGTDLPSSQVVMSGYPTFSVSYSASPSPLFASTGPSMNDINQGYLGDCYLLSSLAEVADKNPNLITSMFTSNGNNTYGVRFYVDGAAEYVTVNNQLADAGNIFNYATDIWASLAEKAFAQLSPDNYGWALTGQSNSWTSIGNGGYPEVALAEITGATTITDFDANGATWTQVVYNASFTSAISSYGISTGSAQNTLIADLAVGDDLVLSSNTNATDSSGRTTLVADHAMSIYGYDASTGDFEIRNPWGTYPGQYWDTTFEVSLSTLLADGDTVTADNVGTGLAAPVLTTRTATQTWKLGQAVNFALPSTTFTDPQAETLTYSAKLSSSAALPSWLTFNSTTDTFTGTVPNTAAGLSLEVTATDTSGLSASETFAVSTPATKPALTAQTANQNWRTGQPVNLVLPANTFTDPQKETLTYKATQASGAALPSWLKFNASTDTFSGTTPSIASSLGIKVTATDVSGLSASETFRVTITAAVGRLAQAISSFSPNSGSVNVSLTQPDPGSTLTLAPPHH